MKLIRFPENPIILPLVGFLFSIPCFYIITQIPEHMQTGRFTILAYVSVVYVRADDRTSPACMPTTRANASILYGELPSFAQ
jgi:hypothetical protein